MDVKQKMKNGYKENMEKSEKIIGLYNLNLKQSENIIPLRLYFTSSMSKRGVLNGSKGKSR